MSTATSSRIWVELEYMGQPVYVDAQEVVSVEQLPRGGTDPFRVIVKYRNSSQTTEVDGYAKDVMARIMVVNLRIAEAASPLPAVGVIKAESYDDITSEMGILDPLEELLGSAKKERKPAPVVSISRKKKDTEDLN